MSDGLSVGAEIGVRIDRLVGLITDQNAQIERDRFERRREQKNRNPIAFSATASLSLGAGTTATVDLGGPQPGRRWVVKRLTLVDQAGLSTVGASVTADFYVTSGVQTTGVDKWVWRLTGLPAAATISTEGVPVTAHDHLVTTVTGVTGHSYYVVAAVLDMDDAGRSKNEYPI